MANRREKGIYTHFVKRGADLTLSALALIILSPVLLSTAVLVRFKLGSPVVFKQPRPGKNEKLFYLYKFRSMTDEMGEDGRLLPDAQRLTKFGRFLRASSLDELLELVNIIKGDMSIVGPRPLSIYYLPHYPGVFRRRHDVRPGLTGLAQVSGRNTLPWDERFKKDIQYVDNLSPALDVKIILDTILKVFHHADISVRGTSDVKDYGPYRILQEEGFEGIRMDGMTYSEIGSYFWIDDKEKNSSDTGFSWLPFMDDSSFTFSGRNAIDLVLQDILKHHDVQEICVPSYCCVSMLQAFIDRGMKIRFYTVERKNGHFVYTVPETNEKSVVLVMSYFGLDHDVVCDMAEKLHSRNTIVIEDVTHTMLSSQTVSEDADYAICSLRKWFAIPAGGWAGKRRGTFFRKPSIDSNHAVEEKIEAMKEKYDYLTGKTESKEHFLLANAKFDNDLIHVDRMLKIDDFSYNTVAAVDTDRIIQARKDNARVLIEGLKDLRSRGLELPEFDFETVTPLFVPVFMDTEQRDSLRKYLTDRGIYCPVHWPEVMGASAGVRANELSLICDQRYTKTDMAAIVDTVHEWYHAQPVGE